MVLQLENTVVILVAQQTAILADPFHVALLTTVEVGDLVFLPTMRKTVCVYLYRNSLHLYFLST
jgi:hypothetical protein